MRKVIDIAFELGDMVYLRTDPQQHERMVISLSVNFNNLIRYCVSFAGDETWHCEQEMSAEKDVLKSIAADEL